MFNFFERVLGFLESFFEFFVNFCESLFLAAEVMTKAIVFPMELAGLLPGILGSSMLIVIALAVAKFILGR